MKRVVVIALALIAVGAVAQEQTAQPQTPKDLRFSTNLTQRDEAPSYSDLYCAGFMTTEAVSKTNAITGGTRSPEETLFYRGTQVFVGGGGLQEGSEYSVVRELKDPNHYEPFKGARAAQAAAGQPYAELGRIKVVATRGTEAVAEVEFSCQNMTLGDIVIPFHEHAPVTYRKSGTMERFPSAPGHLNARIVMGQEFDAEAGQGRKVYINAGSNKGVKVGDYFRAVRGYDPEKLNESDSLSYKGPVGEDTQKVPGSVTAETAKQLPLRNLGEMIVLNVTPSSSTAMITNSLEDIMVGDYVELEENPAQ